MTSLIRVIDADNTLFNTIHAFLNSFLLESLHHQKLITFANPLANSNIWWPRYQCLRLYLTVGVCHASCPFCPSYPLILSWWNDTNKRQAYVQAGFASEDDTSHDWSVILSLVRFHTLSSQSSMLMGLEEQEFSPAQNRINPAGAAGRPLLLWWVSLSCFSFLTFVFFHFPLFYMMIYYIFITTVNIRNFNWWPPPVTGLWIWSPLHSNHVFYRSLSFVSITY